MGNWLRRIARESPVLLFLLGLLSLPLLAWYWPTADRLKAYVARRHDAAVALARSGPGDEAERALREFLESYPDAEDAPSARYHLGLVIFQRASAPGRPPEETDPAFTLVRSAAAADPKLREAAYASLRTMIRHLEAASQLVRARDEMEALAAGHPEKTDLLLDLVRLDLAVVPPGKDPETGVLRHPEAEGRLARYLKEAVEPAARAAGLLAKADLDDRLGRPADSVRLLDAELVRPAGARRGDLLLRRGRLLLRTGAPDAALRDLEEAKGLVEGRDRKADVQYFEAEAHRIRQTGPDLVRARALFFELAAGGERVSPLSDLGLGRLSDLTENWDAALRSFEEGLAEIPSAGLFADYDVDVQGFIDGLRRLQIRALREPGLARLLVPLTRIHERLEAMFPKDPDRRIDLEALYRARAEAAGKEAARAAAAGDVPGSEAGRRAAEELYLRASDAAGAVPGLPSVDTRTRYASLLQAGKDAFEGRDFPRARDLLETFLRDAPDEIFQSDKPEAMFRIGKSLQLEGNHTAALAAFARFDLKFQGAAPFAYRAWIERARSQEELGRPEQAVEEAARVFRSDLISPEAPEWGEALLLSGRSHLTAARRIETAPRPKQTAVEAKSEADDRRIRARQAFEEYLARYAGRPGDDGVLAAHFHLAEIRREAGDHEAALDHYRAVVREEGPDPAPGGDGIVSPETRERMRLLAHFAAGDVLYRLGAGGAGAPPDAARLREAIEAYQKAARRYYGKERFLGMAGLSRCYLALASAPGEASEESLREAARYLEQARILFEQFASEFDTGTAGAPGFDRTFWKTTIDDLAKAIEDRNRVAGVR